VEAASAIIAVGLIVFLAHLFGAVFEKTRVPDVLPLVLLGLILGPMLHWVQPKDFGHVGQVFTTLALVIILFDCGLELDLGLLAKSFISAVKLGLSTFAITVGTTVWLGAQALGLTPVEGCILGSIAAASSPPIVIPILAKLSISEQTRTTLILESTICEVLGIVSTLAFINMAQQNELQPVAMVGHVISSFVLAAAVGVFAGVIWSSVLKYVRRVEDIIFCTPAFVCIVYGIAELFDWSGPVAALVFGLVLGNIRELKWLRELPKLPVEKVGLTHTEKTFFAALVFLFKSLFFVYVGISMQFNSQYLMIAAGVLTLWTIVVRLVVSRITLGTTLSVRDSSLVAIMVPKGLAAAVLASLVLESGVSNAASIREVAFGVILFSICTVSLLSFLIERGYLDGFFGYAFGSHRPATVGGAGVDGELAATLAEGAVGTDAAIVEQPNAGSRSRLAETLKEPVVTEQPWADPEDKR